MNKNYRDEMLKQACFKFNVGFEQATLIRSNKNLVYDCGDKILRISPSAIRSKSEIEVEINWLIFLLENKLPVVEPVRSGAENYIEVIDNPDAYATAVCFDKIVGERITKPYWNDRHFRNLGKLTGALHRFGKQYRQNAPCQEWDNINEFKCWKYLPEDERALPELHQKLVGLIRQLPGTKDNYGLIHYDIHHGNYLLTRDNTQLQLFDFEMTCQSWYINDVSTVLYYAHQFPKETGDDAFEAVFMKHFREGYEEEHHIDEDEYVWIPVFLLYRDLMVYGVLSGIWKEKVLTSQETAYLQMIQESIRNRRNKLGL